jgi:hypothetical protein
MGTGPVGRETHERNREAHREGAQSTWKHDNLKKRCSQPVDQMEEYTGASWPIASASWSVANEAVRIIA